MVCSHETFCWSVTKGSYQAMMAKRTTVAGGNEHGTQIPAPDSDFINDTRDACANERRNSTSGTDRTVSEEFTVWNGPSPEDLTCSFDKVRAQRYAVRPSRRTTWDSFAISRRMSS